MSAISGTIGAVLGSKSQDKANEINRANTQETNALNYKMFQDSRGGRGHAVLPTYMGNFEKELGGYLADSFWNSDVDKSKLTQSVEAMSPGMTGGATSVNSLFDGRTKDKMLSNFKPVAAARLSNAKQASSEALHKTLADIDAMQAKKGYSGDSLGERMLTFNANRAQGTAVGNANLANIEEERMIRDAVMQSQLQNATLPYQMSSYGAQAYTTPESLYLELMNQRMQPLSFMGIGPQAFNYQPYSTVEANPGAGALAMAGISQAGGMALDYALGQKAQKDWFEQQNNLMRNRPGAGPATGFNFQPDYSGWSWLGSGGGGGGAGAGAGGGNWALDGVPAGTFGF